MGVTAWHNRDMRWPWSGIQEELRLLREQHDRHIEEYRSFTTELVMDMRRYAEQRERAVNRRLDEIHEQTQEVLAEQRAGREALFRMMDRLGPGPDAASA
jgi:hypothetical protein